MLQSPPPSRARPTDRIVDRLGAAGSLLCAIHCALLPVAVALLPALGLAALRGDGVERAFVVFASALGMLSLAQGYRRHRTVQALWLLLPGLGLLWAGVLVHALHDTLVPHAVAMATGGALVGLAHLANLRLGHHVHGPYCAH